MSARQLDPHPVAELLLDLGLQRADGSLDVGARVVSLRGGAIVDVSGASGSGGDPDVAELLHLVGKLSRTSLDAVRADVRLSGAPIDEALLRRGEVDAGSIDDAMRAVWVDRLARAFGATKAGPVAAFVPGGGRATSRPLPTLPIVLDALARFATAEGTDLVAADPSARVEWAEGAISAAAREWAGFADVPADTVLRTVLARSPAAGPRVAAAVAAGLATIVTSATAVQAAPPRPSKGPPTRPSQVPGGVASSRLAPGRAPPRELEYPESGAVPLPEVAALVNLDDPVEVLENELASVAPDESGGPARAQLYRSIAEAHLKRFSSPDEALRALREASAAAPADRASHLAAAVASARAGELRLAVAYARAAVATSTDASDRAAALLLLARIHEHTGEIAAALSVYADAAVEAKGDPTAPLALARVLFAHGDLSTAMHHVVEAIARVRNSPDLRNMRLAVAAGAYALAPLLPESAMALADALADRGATDLATVVLIDAARDATNADALLELARTIGGESAVDGIAAARLSRLAKTETRESVEALAQLLFEAERFVDLAILGEWMAARESGPHKRSWTLRSARSWARAGRFSSAVVALTASLANGDITPDPEVRALLDELVRSAPDATVSADALERVVRSQRLSGAPDAALLAMLARHDEVRLGGVRRPLDLLSQAMTLGHPIPPAEKARLEGKSKLSDGLLEAAERELSIATPATRVGAARRLAGLLLDDPRQRERALGLFGEVLEASPDDEVAAAAIERLLYVLDDLDGLATFLDARARLATNRASAARLFARLLATHAERRDEEGVIAAARGLLVVAPGDEEACARLTFHGIVRRDAAAVAEGLRHQLERTSKQPARSRMALERARALIGSGATDEVPAVLAEARGALPIMEAVWLIVREHSRLPARDSARALRGAPAIMQELPQTWAALAELSGRSQSFHDAIAAARSAARLDPFGSVALVDAIGYACHLRSAPEIIATATALLAAPHPVPQGKERILAALDVLEVIGESVRGAELAIAALDRFGAVNERLARRAVELARTADRAELITAALERAISGLQGDDRLGPLRELAGHHRLQKDLAAEARTWLRVLAVSVYDREALDRLTEIYASTGRFDRLLAVLSLRGETVASMDERRRVMRLEIAAALAAGDQRLARERIDELLRSAGDDLLVAVDGYVYLGLVGAWNEGAEGLVTMAARLPPPDAERALLAAVALAERHGDREAPVELARRALGITPHSGRLLVELERLALRAGMIATAQSVYETLASRAFGPHGKRALDYRAARFLEAAGERELALDAYVRTFEDDPTPGAVFRSIERLSGVLGRAEPLVRALEVLAERARHVEARLLMLTRAGDLLETRVGDFARAAKLFQKAWDTAATSENEQRLRRAIRRTRELNPRAAEETAQALITAMRTRAEQSWDGVDRARWFLRAARVQFEDLGAVDPMHELVNAARAVPPADMVGDARIEVLCDAAELLARHRPFAAEAAQVVADALEIDPQHERARVLADSLPPARASVPAQRTSELRGSHPPSGRSGRLATPPPPGPGRRGSRPPVVVEIGPPEGRSDRRSDPPAGANRPTDVVPPPSPLPSRRPDTSLARAHDALAANDFAAAEDAITPLLGDVLRAHAAAEILRTILRRDPARVSAMRSLVRTADSRGSRAERHTLESLLSLIDGAGRSARRLAVPVNARVAVDDALAAADAGWRAALAVVWDAATPLLRRPLAEFQVTGQDRVGPEHPSVIGVALAAARAVLGETTPALYVRRAPGPALTVAPTAPPSVVVDSSFDVDEVTARFRIGRMLAMATPETIPLAGIPKQKARAIVAALWAAFGPTRIEGVPSTPPREATAFVSDLWQVVPPAAQRELRRLLALAQPLTFEELLVQHRVLAARVGLLMSLDLGASAIGLLADEPSLAGSSIVTDAAFGEAVRSSPDLAGLVRFALTDAYLAVCAQALG